MEFYGMILFERVFQTSLRFWKWQLKNSLCFFPFGFHYKEPFCSVVDLIREKMIHQSTFRFILSYLCFHYNIIIKHAFSYDPTPTLMLLSIDKSNSSVVDYLLPIPILCLAIFHTYLLVPDYY